MSLSAVFLSGRVRRALDVVAIVMMAACNGSDPIGAAGNGSIRGAVTDDTGATMANVAVDLTGNGQAARTANSGTDGVYTFADLRPGTYTLAVKPPTGFTTGAAGTASVTVAGGSQASAAAFVLDRVTSSNGSIRGTVTDDSGAGVANAVVALTGNAQAARTTISGASGVYTFAELPPEHIR